MKNRQKIHTRIRKTLHGTATRPRLSVYRSLNNIFAQLINDETQTTLAGVSSLKTSGSLTAKGEAVGKAIALKAKELKVTAAVFDRGGFPYRGAVKKVAESARQEGLTL